MGRKPLPDQVKELRGTERKCRKKTATATASICKPLTKTPVPAWLQLEARKIFTTTSKMLISWKVLTKLDINLLAAYATAYANLMKADADIEDAKGYFYEEETKNGTTLKLHPAAKMFKDSLDLVNKIGSQFGLSPIARKGMEQPNAADSKKKDVDPFDAYL